MKSKKILIILSIILASIFLFGFSNKVSAMTISDDGKYALVLNVSDGEIDGKYAKVIKFNVAEGETTVKLSELTKGIVPFNGRNEFSHWGKNFTNDEKADEELAIADFKSSGETSGISFTNGLVLWGKFSDKALKGTGTYYLTIDPFAGKINGKDILKITSKSSEFKTVDLSKYIPVREGYTFIGWDYKGKFITSIDKNYFKDSDVVEVTAVYKKNTFEEDDYYVLKLDANGGKIDGKDSNRYNYIGGSNSGTSMPIFHYIPVREGYTFNGWNTKKDGTGKNYKYMYWAFWRNEGASEFEKDTLKDTIYQNITLYASWTKNPETPTTKPTQPTQPTQTTEKTVKEIQSTGETKAKIEFANAVSNNYELNIEPVEVKKVLTDKNIKYIVDINVLENKQVIKISDTKMKIRIEMPENLKNYNKYEVVYILNDEVKETLPATVEDGYIVFETSHLSQYGVIATNVETQENTNTNNVSKNGVNNPKTGDNIIMNATLFIVSVVSMIAITIVNKKRQ